ncbi:MAG: sigma 54-interacting transcriptional regulator, partial [Cetobacterium sp.]|uniref:sigma 54-interacting transcriptional regulator n=1 Tax=Cetobacterium sp. TaxID=2071632 RepID=UPI002FC86511
TLFLDEIGDAPLHIQARLLRVLQEREITPVGGTDIIPVDIRIIAATNKNLLNEVKNKNFREDLYYRLNVIPVVLPTLRQRKNDIHLLIEYMIKEYSSKLNKNVEDVDFQALEYLCDYSWPGNIRELQNIIEYSVNRCEGKTITLDNIPNRVKNIDKDEEISLNSNEHVYTLDELEKHEILKALEKYKEYK